VTKQITVVDVDKIGSATSPLGLSKTVGMVSSSSSPQAGDVVVVRALTDSATYNMLELPTGRLAKINPGDLLIGVLGRRRALRGAGVRAAASLALFLEGRIERQPRSRLAADAAGVDQRGFGVHR